MSDALDYLVKARPDAIVPYFKFLKESGRHLDPRTRDLISVITKVASQTRELLWQQIALCEQHGVAHGAMRTLAERLDETRADHAGA